MYLLKSNIVKKYAKKKPLGIQESAKWRRPHFDRRQIFDQGRGNKKTTLQGFLGDFLDFLGRFNSSSEPELTRNGSAIRQSSRRVCN